LYNRAKAVVAKAAVERIVKDFIVAEGLRQFEKQLKRSVANRCLRSTRNV